MRPHNVKIENHIPGDSPDFRIAFSETNNISWLSHPDDGHQMNWAGSTQKWGEVRLNLDLDVTITREALADHKLRETYTFTNNTDFDIYTQIDDVGIYATFPDHYDSAEVCMAERCHAHIWCGGEVSYIMGLRMGGDTPHLGLMLTRGCIENYSIERDFNQSSNNRGNIILHPAPFILLPGQSYVVAWELFWHQGKEDFYHQLKTYPHYIHVEAEKYILFAGEVNRVEISHSFSQINSVEILCQDRSVPYTVENHSLIIDDLFSTVGEYRYSVTVNGINTSYNILVLPPPGELIRARCEFIVRYQQCHREDSRLDGAYLVYDNETNSMYYSHYHDHNGGRERFGMGVLIAKYLQTQDSAEMEQSLMKYVKYIERELFDTDSGEVYNDIGRNNDIHRLYNYPWLAVLYMELYNLHKDQRYLIHMSKILHAYYRNGGDQFYPIELPMYKMIHLLRENGLSTEAESLFASFQRHVDFIYHCGTSYPPSEVNYEQSIVAPAANCLIQMYHLCKEEKYLIAFREHLRILELFNGRQPDYNLYEVAIRHWDGYWFGKRRLLGDTFPHYWSSLSGRVYQEYAQVAESEDAVTYGMMSEQSLRGVLSLFQPDGRASCARLFPLKVNEIPGQFDDPWANDQDWALYFMLSSEMARL